MRRIVLVLGTMVLLTTGVALATPVPVLTVGDGSREFVGRLDDGEPLRYSYRQSIYDAPVYEDFERVGDRIEFRRVRSSDIRSIEYFRWDNEIVQGPDGWWSADAPPSDIKELVIRIAPLGQQRFVTSAWSCDLLARFGETVVRVRADRMPLGLALVKSR